MLTPQQIEAMSYALNVRQEVVRVAVEVAWKIARNECRKEIIEIIESENSNTSPETGYGKAQRAIVSRLLMKITLAPAPATKGQP